MALRLLPCRPAVAAFKCPMLGLLSVASVEQHQVRGIKANKHFNPKYKNLRRLKVDMRFPLKYQNNLEQATLDGVSQHIPAMARMWKERDFYISCSNQLVDEYVPEESKEGYDHSQAKKVLTSAWGKVESLPKNKLALRKIRGFEEDFNLKVFGDEAKEIYIKAHECLAANDREKLNDYVTEHARLAMLLNAQMRTIHWKFLESLEEPRVVQVRTFHADENKSSTFAQITVKMFSQQTLAVYDRFGRLMYGSEILAKDVLEYVIFEKHLSNEYGTWRLHAKIIPPSLIKMGERTFVAPEKLTKEANEVTAAPVKDVPQDVIQS